MSILCALAGLAAFLCSDFQAIGRLSSRVWRAGFWVGLALWVAASILSIRPALSGIVIWRAVIFGSLALVFVFFEIYALFFALPFEKTYLDAPKKRRVCRQGLYGLCRHPGFWSFSGICLSLGLALNSPSVWGEMGLLAFLNLVYIIIQDQYIFIREFSDYPDYQKEVPFLLPCRKKR